MGFLLGLDVGNTRVKAYRLPEDAWSGTPSPEWTADIPSFAVPNSGASSLPDRLEARWGWPPDHVHVVSVRPDVSAQLQDLFDAEGVAARFWDGSDLPMKHPYENPYALGPDRLLAAMATSWLYPERDVILVDAGTAVTVDWIDDQGRFRGGAILPGRAALAAALAAAGAMLPQVTGLAAASFPGEDTESSMTLGLRAAFEGGVQRMLELARAVAPEAWVVVTGGDFEHVHRLLEPERCTAIPDLLGLGLALLEHRA